MILGESFILTGKIQKGTSLIKEGWVTAELSKSELRFYRKKFKKTKKTILSPLGSIKTVQCCIVQREGSFAQV